MVATTTRIPVLVGPTGHMKHFWRKKKIRAHDALLNYVLRLLYNCTYPKINENCLVIMIDHDIVWLDVPMDHLGNFVAVMQSF